MRNTHQEFWIRPILFCCPAQSLSMTLDWLYACTLLVVVVVETALLMEVFRMEGARGAREVELENISGRGWLATVELGV